MDSNLVGWDLFGIPIFQICSTPRDEVLSNVKNIKMLYVAVGGCHKDWIYLLIVVCCCCYFVLFCFVA